jgi:pimeloyl-ACP methyl ester carboxylesterase
MSTVYRSVEGEQAVLGRYRLFLEHWPAPNEQVRVSTREGETFVIVSGPADAPALVLLHGAVFNSVTWMGDVASWARTHRVYAVDLIGQPGLSAPSRPPYASERHCLWLDDVLSGLGIEQAALLGMSLGGWIAIDYATRRSKRVSKLVLLCPAGVGRLLIGPVKLFFGVLPLLMLGRWGRSRVMAKIVGVPSAATSNPAARAVGDFTALIFKHFRANRARVPSFADDTLARLDMPVMLIVGARDAMLDSNETRERLTRCVKRLQVRYLPDVGHAVLGQTEAILGFLQRP